MTNMEIDIPLASLQDLDLIVPLVAAYHAFEALGSTKPERKSGFKMREKYVLMSVKTGEHN